MKNNIEIIEYNKEGEMKIEEMINKIFLETKNGFEYVKEIPDKSIDMILCDLPYGITACKWDTIIPFEPLWEQYKRIIKDNGAIVLTASQPFTSALVMSNIKMFKYCAYWKKEKPTNFFQLKRRLGRTIEDILVFYNKQPTFNPQKTKHEGKLVKNNPKGNHNSIISGVNKKVFPYKDDGFRYPIDLIEIRRDILGTTTHPTQKPVALFEYLIKTYTNETNIVLDNCIGSGTTAVACKKLNRIFIGMEIYQNYIDISYKRLSEVKQGEGLIPQEPKTIVEPIILETTTSEIIKKGRGRPKGSKNKAKIIEPDLFTINKDK
jgi:site-specific DNA-methyltransferase (adenine-specific)